MSFSEMLEKAEPRRILRINTMVPDWVPDEIYEAEIKFRLLSMDGTGMTVEVISTNLEDKKEDREESSKEPMKVVPSPS